MTDLLQNNLPTTVRELNETPLSQNVKALMESPQEHQLILAQLLTWATDHLAADPAWAEAVDGAVSLAAENDPQAAYQNLANPMLESVTTLQEAGRAILAWVADLIPPGTQPA